jgi:uncharacterized membrane protein
MTLKSNIGLAAAAAVFALSAGATTSVMAQSTSTAAKVQCFGVNACKGQSDCKSGAHDCKGQNSCKGQGFKSESAKKCAAQGGTTTQP